MANPFAGTPVLTRTDPTVDFSWGEGLSRLAGRRKQLLGQVDWSTEGTRLEHLHLHGHRPRKLICGPSTFRRLIRLVVPGVRASIHQPSPAA